MTEEAGELSAAALAGTDEEVIAEAADLLYHALVLLEARGLELGAVEEELGSPARGRLGRRDHLERAEIGRLELGAQHGRVAGEQDERLVRPDQLARHACTSSVVTASRLLR